jgi:hypothetical protein
VSSHVVPEYGTFWSVQIASKRYVKRFAEHIGFACERKERAAKDVKISERYDRSTLKLEGFEHEYEKLHDTTTGDLRQRVGAVIRGVSKLTENIVRRLDHVEAFVGTDLEKMLDDGLWTVSVTYIEPDGEEEVFDLYEPVHKMMMASGLMVGDTNFALLFLGSPWTLAFNTGRDANDPEQLEECKQHFDHWFELYPEIKLYQQDMIDHAYEHGWVPTIGGRRGHVKNMLEGCDKSGKYIEDPDKRKGMIKHAERLATNIWAQGCLHPETRIITREHGVSQIGQLSGPITVWDGERWSKAGVLPSGKKRELLVRFWGGLEVRCSPDHRFWTRNHGGASSGWSSGWKTAAEFKKQQFVVLSDAAMDWSTNTKWAEFSSQGNGAQDLTINSLSGFDQGLFLGRVASDGSVVVRPDGGYVMLFVADHEKEILPKLRSLCQKLGRFIEHEIDRSHENKQRMFRLDINSTSLAKQLLPIKAGIPGEVWADSDVLRGYLCGMFDGDGTVHTSGPRLCLGSGHKHAEWAKEIQQALFAFGIRSRFSLNQATRIDVNVQKADSIRFAEWIGFLSRTKQKKLEAIAPKRSYEPAYGRVLRVAEVIDTGHDVEMYDVVNSETSRFSANGVITHNSEADVVKMALNLIAQSKKLKKLRHAPLFPVHDEVVCESPTRNSKDGLDEQIRLMKLPYADKMAVPLAVEGGIGANWLSGKP